ncbi:hypothetical protein L1987_34522 [Smallanthus sonchifolius]|uniref:Uncharacterized protein n=1 Tax=Smallanthus sonchifolius TaxID=185202 RepID=A0ACB9HVB8_9ASTR|nr:hypothetical protein L1987_34522 [Smallanthus sonchifolius]
MATLQDPSCLYFDSKYLCTKRKRQRGNALFLLMRILTTTGDLTTHVLLYLRLPASLSHDSSLSQPSTAAGVAHQPPVITPLNIDYKSTPLPHHFSTSPVEAPIPSCRTTNAASFTVAIIRPPPFSFAAAVTIPRYTILISSF